MAERRVILRLDLKPGDRGKFKSVAKELNADLDKVGAGLMGRLGSVVSGMGAAVARRLGKVFGDLSSGFGQQFQQAVAGTAKKIEAKPTGKKLTIPPAAPVPLTPTPHVPPAAKTAVGGGQGGAPPIPPPPTGGPPPGAEPPEDDEPAKRAAKILKARKASELDLLRDPALLRAQIAHDLKREKAKMAYEFEASKERARQQGALGDLLHFPGLGGKVAGVGAGMGGRFGGFLQNLGGGLAGQAAGGLGGAIGAAAGPIGIALGAAKLLYPVVKSLVSVPFKVIVSGLGAVNNALKALGGTLGPIGAHLGFLQGIGESMSKTGKTLLNPLMAAVGEAISGVSKQAQMFLETTVALAAKAQPGVVKRFGLALDDTAAVIGHRLVPIVELMTKVVRGIGDILHTVLPSTQDMRAALAPLGDAFADIKQSLADVAPLIKDALLVGLKLFGEFLKLIAKGVRGLVNLARSFGLLSGTGKLQSSMGLAARPAHFTSPDEYAKSIYQAAFSQGYDPQKTTADNTSKILEVLTFIKDVLVGIPTTIGGYFTDLRDFLAEIPTTIGGYFEGFQDFLGEIPTTIAGYFDDFLTALTELPAQIGQAISDALANILPGADKVRETVSGATESLGGFGSALLNMVPGGGIAQAFLGGGAPAVNPNEQTSGGGGADAQMARNNQLLEQIAAGLQAMPGGGLLAGAARRTWFGLGGG